MLYYLTELAPDLGALNVFRYITFRAGGAFLTALVFGFMFGRPLIELLRVRQGRGQPIRSDGPESHILAKAGTPTMGGLLILSAILVSTLLWARWDNGFVWMVLFVTLGFGLIGFADDYAKVSKQTHAGVSGRLRLAIGFMIALVAAAWAMKLHPEPLTGELAFPVFKAYLLDLAGSSCRSRCW
jgi:phospho-N-acetylmuramoyl-pentapeptide-transferase